MAFSVSTVIAEFLKANPEKRFTAREIASWIIESYPDDCEVKLAKSKNKNLDLADTREARTQVLVNILVAEISSQRPRIQSKTPQIKSTGEKPRRYYFTQKSDDAEVKAAEGKETDIGYEFRLYSKRIDERKSSNTRGSKGNEWLYPDLVALEDLASEWHHKVAECAS